MGATEAEKKERETEEIEEVEFLPPLPPDGGWGWMVVLGSLLANFIVDGVCFTFGIFYVEFLNEFQESKQKTAWAGSLIPGLYLGLGPIVAALANKYSCRRVTMIGSVFASTAFILATRAPNVDWLILTYGVMGGIGFGLMYLPSIVIVGYYFDKKRATATGIGVCGSGVGAFVFAPLGQYLISEFGWRGANLIIAGIILNGVICGALFRPLEPRRVRHEPDIDPMKIDHGLIMQKIKEAKDRERTISTGSLNNAIITRNNDLVRATIQDSDTAKKTDKNDPSGMIHNQLHPGGSNEGVTDGADHPVTEEDSTSDMHGSSANVTPKPINKNLIRVQYGLHGSALRLRKVSTASTKEEDAHRVKLLSEGSDGSVLVSRESLKREVSRPLYRQDIFYTGSITSIPQFHHAQDMDSYVASVVSIPVVDEADGNGCKAKCAPAWTVLTEMIDFSLMKLPSFSILCLTSVLAMIGFFTPFVYIVDYCVTEIGTPIGTATICLSILGLANTLGRIMSGWISDRPWADCVLIQNGALVIAGIATCMVPFIKNFYFIAIYCCVFGLCIAAFIALRSIVLVDILGLEKLSNSFGILLLFQGLAGLVGSPIAGMLFDATGSYVASFVSSGILLGIGGVISLPLRQISRCERRHEKNARDDLAMITVERESNI